MANVLTATQKYEDEDSFTNLLTRLAITPTQRQRLNIDGFTTMKSLVQHYRTSGPKQFKAYLKDLNKTFATASTQALRVYYNPIAINRLVGCLYYFQNLLYTFHSIMDIDLIGMHESDTFSDFWTKFSNDEEKSKEDDEVEIPQLKGHTNWTSFRDAFLFKLRAVKCSRGFSMEYLLDEESRAVRHANAAYQVLDIVLDLTDNDVFKEKAVFIGDAFKLDNIKLWNMLEGQIINTDPYNHISAFSKQKHGKNAWNALKLHYEGENAKQRLRTIAMDKLKSTKYFGDTKYFTFEKYINIHVKAHKQLLDIKFNDGKGLDDDTKIFYFKEGIEHKADLETALTLARTKESESFQDYVIFLSTEVDSKNRRKRLTVKNERRVSQVKTKPKSSQGRKPNFEDLDLGPMLHEIVEGKRIESKHYDKSAFSSLSSKQRATVIKLNRQRRRRALQNQNSGKSSNVSAMTRDQINDDMITVGNAIVAAISKGTNEGPDDVITLGTNDDSKQKRNATAGSVGDFFAQARKRSKSNL